jgi:hypothetical protein
VGGEKEVGSEDKAWPVAGTQLSEDNHCACARWWFELTVFGEIPEAESVPRTRADGVSKHL